MKTRTGSLVAFFVLSFAIAVPVFLLYTRQTTVLAQLLLLILGSYAPAISAVAVVVLSKERGVAAFWQRLRKWRASKQVVLVAFILPTAGWLLAYLLGQVFFGAGGIQFAALAAFPVVFLANLGEEIGWRGFALPHLLDLFKPLPASLILGFIWACFHLAIYWQRPLFAVLIFPSLLALSVIITWLFIRSGGSVAVCTFFHAVFNAWSQAVLAGEGSEGAYILVIVIMAAAAAFFILRYGKSLSAETYSG